MHYTFINSKFTPRKFKYNYIVLFIFKDINLKIYKIISNIRKYK